MKNRNKRVFFLCLLLLCSMLLSLNAVASDIGEDTNVAIDFADGDLTEKKRGKRAIV